jgi:hypothetical protein
MAGVCRVYDDGRTTDGGYRSRSRSRTRLWNVNGGWCCATRARDDDMGRIWDPYGCAADRGTWTAGVESLGAYDYIAGTCRVYYYGLTADGAHCGGGWRGRGPGLGRRVWRKVITGRAVLRRIVHRRIVLRRIVLRRIVLRRGDPGRGDRWNDDQRRFVLR